MNNRRMLGLAAATALVVGLGATTAYSATAGNDTKPRSSTPASSASTANPKDTKDMIKQCVRHLPAAKRAKAEKLMREMMGSAGSMMDDDSMGSMMGGASPSPQGSMMYDGSTSHSDHHQP